MHRILVVEDNEDNRLLVEKILIRKGYQVFTACDGEEALAICQRETFDLVLMDISLPGIDGLELTKLLKADDRNKNLPIVALTAHALREFIEKAKEAGCIEYLTKPFTPKELYALLDKVLGRQMVEV